jgi:hypothetical protein
MRITFAWVALTAIFGVLSHRVEAAGQEEPRADVFKEAEEFCVEWTKDGTSAKVIYGAKNDAKTIRQDFADMRKELAAAKDLPKELAAILKVVYQKDPAREESVELLVGLWFEWRVRRQADQFAKVLKDFDQLVKIRFKSQPEKAEVLVNSMLWGKTIKHVVLNKTAKYSILIRKDGYKDHEKSGYAPDPAQPVYEVELVKK